ncbi:uncharacterized protein EI90DRAFT_3149570 [Cantharellus anzutake]|uniref:uncharacterized protein n=1 Tax=Cantharellus anzutake TaxID=1750568 RepID=UPI0019048753|nr:uncharacterized protein EI90DRAFT_3149570 [Cantharellus anzutake]KAF8344165.1 hypothetical protein EI90DRAFT_3149570 [Cantharellus anzutake]
MPPSPPMPAAPPPMVQNPISGTTINTSPSQLHLDPFVTSAPDTSDNAVLPTGHKTCNFVQRVVNRTAEKLTPSRSVKRTGTSRLSSALRQSKAAQGSDASSGDEEDGHRNPQSSKTNVSPTSMTRSAPGFPFPSTASSSSQQQIHQQAMAQSQASFRRPPLDGSLRQGTQTLIQALQAIPWEQDDDDVTTTPVEVGEITSDEELDFPISSSIHTIHRSRDTTMPTMFTRSRLAHSPDDYYANHPSEDEEYKEEADFDESMPQASPAMLTGQVLVSTPPEDDLSPVSVEEPVSPLRIQSSRVMSVATVRLRRRAQLATKLREVFEIPDITEVVAELPCWLLRSVLLQGYVYLTNSHLCFFAHMPAREDQVLKSGTLSKRASHLKRWNKHWFVLKNDVLSWYQSSTASLGRSRSLDPYFPHGNVDLRYAISCEAVDDKVFKLRTNQKTITLSADSTASRDEWVKAIRKIIFKAQNMGESVKIAIPYSVIIDIDRSNAMDFSETIEVKVIDRDEHFTMDSYFFAYFQNISEALEQIRTVVSTHRVSDGAALEAVSDTTVHRTPSRGPQPHAARSGATNELPTSFSPPSSSSGFRLASLLRPFSEAPSLLRRSSGPSEASGPTIDYTHVLHTSPTQSSSPHAESTLTLSPTTGSIAPSISSGSSDATARPNGFTAKGHTYPPGTQLIPPTTEVTISETQPITTPRASWTGVVPSWFKSPSRRLFVTSNPSLTSYQKESHGGVKEVLDQPIVHHSESEEGHSSSLDGGNHLGFSILEAPDHEVADAAVVEKFRQQFALDEKETLVGYIPGSLFRVLPVSGRLYISTNYLCFRSSQPLTKTRMMVPIRDILSTEKQKAFRFGHHGMTAIIKGHEELFFEFNSSERRNACVDLLDRQMNELRQKQLSGEVPQLSQGKREALILEEFDNISVETEARPPPESESLPAVMFTSTSSTFLSFKPTKPLRFTCLTIGSRGDVQPYIALCKGLKADGHQVRIATHTEYKDWIEGHGIEYGQVGGDPAELMRICVENGMFTFSFMKETMQKFRGWLDDLLKTSWEACQNTDVLIESPSAMGGLHIAEALKIPYFRAFTMPWTRSRAYPHAFAVPDRKMGGGYNYMTYVMFDQVFWRATAGQINRWRKNMLGLESTSLDKMEQHKVPFLYNFSPTVVPPPLDWYEWIRVTGYWFLDDADDSTKKKWTPPEGLVPFIDGAHAKGKKVVYIGFGSIVVSDPEAMTRCVVDAIVQSGVYAILSKGWSDRMSTKKGPQPEGDNAELPTPSLPPQIYPLTSVPHDWLFPRIDAACHHGGAGTTGASLRAGIPTIIKPFFGDQFFWADRMEALGIGSSVRKLTVENLTEALKAATADQKQIDRARLIGEAIRAEKGVANAIEDIYRNLEYARSLIKRPPQGTPRIPESALSTPPSSPSRLPNNVSSTASNSTSEYARGTSDDWSVISGEDSGGLRPSSSYRSNAEVSQSLSKRYGRAGATLSALGEAFSLSRHNLRKE